MIILHFHLQPQFKYELFHIYFKSIIVIILTSALTIVLNQNNALGPETLNSKHKNNYNHATNITMFEINQCEVCGCGQGPL